MSDEQDDRPLGLIGGHQGMAVERHFDRGHYAIKKMALHEADTQHADMQGVDLFGLNVTALHNEAAMLDAMTDSGYTPDLLDINEGVVWQSDVGVHEAPQDMEAWRRNCVRMLATIRAHGLRHGDLRGTNVITRADWPWAIDWQEGHRIGDVAPQKSPYTDSNLLMQHIEGTAGPNGQLDTPRVARRWRCVLDSLGATTNLTLPLKDKLFLDLGCFQGDFVALAAAEGMLATGVDRGGFRSGENSIEIAQRLWADFPFGEIGFVQDDVLSMTYNWDVVVMFSTWPYVVHDYGRRQADDLLRAIIRQASVFFFETQLAGDGPGPNFLQTDEDVAGLLLSVGAKVAKPIATFPVTGRPASRTVWRVEG
jgi:SAM-dependent methyltransferase